MINNTWILGHRANYPEKLNAYYSQGVDGVEFDLRTCGDKICLRHGLTNFFRGPLGYLERFFSKIILGDLWRPYLLDDMIDKFQGVLVLDIKRSGIEEILLEKFGSRKEVFFTSFKKSVAVKIKKLDENAKVGPISFSFNKSLIDFAIKNDMDVVSVKYKSLKKELVDQCKEHGIEVFTWTLNNVNIAKKVINWGLKAIITDVPGLLISELKKME